MGFLTANDTPGQHPRSWYAETAGALPDHPALDGSTKADVCIVGGGYAGLSAALHLAEAGLDVVLLEANRIGWGASGRNGGQLGYGPRADIGKYERTVGKDDARKVWDIAAEANRLVRDLIDRHAIDCDWTPGYVEAAWKPAHAGELSAHLDHLREVYGHPGLTPLSREELREIIPTERYHGGFIDREAGHLHPLRLALGLGRAAAAAGARIHERSPATSIADGRVETATGTVEADWVIAAMNGYIDGLVPRAARRTLPLNNFIVATEPLGDRLGEFIRQPVAVCDTKYVLNYWRPTPDDRILWGGGESYGMRFPASIEATVRRQIATVFPKLAKVPVTHAWGGTLAITATRMPAFQRLGPRTLSISGWSGSGIHMGTMGGKIAAEAVRGTLARWDLMQKLPTPAFPGGRWFRTPLQTLAMLWYSLRDRL